MTPSEHKQFKRLTRPQDNLRDHMTDLELIFTMLGEKVTTEISQTEQPESFEANKKVAKRGGRELVRPAWKQRRNWAEV